MTCSFELQPEYDLVNVFCTLDSGKNLAICLLIFRFFSWAKLLILYSILAFDINLEKERQNSKNPLVSGLNFKGVGLLKGLQ